ncbi:hypothetical protein ACVWZV_007268 [Bradyrhizobium sp. GM5.1]
MMALARQVGSGQKLPPPNAILSLSGSGRHPRIGVEILMLDFLRHPGQEDDTPDSVYKVIELVGTSNDSLGEGRRKCGRASCKISPRSSHCRGRQAGYAAR